MAAPRRRVPDRWLLVLATLGLAALLGWQNGLGRFDRQLYDTFLAAMPHPPSDRIVIVSIDDPSLAELGRWPWPRDVYTDLIERISVYSPRAIGLDLLLSEPDAHAIGADERLAQALQRSGVVVLPVFMAALTGTAYTPVPPLPGLQAAAAGLGHVSVELDSDGMVRSVFLREGTGGNWWPHFATRLLEVAGYRQSQAALPGRRDPDPSPGHDDGLWHRDYWLPIDFAGPPGTYAHISASDVLRGDVPPGLLENRIVLVGTTAIGLGDVYPTPVSGESVLMPGVEISANIIDNMLSGRILQTVQPWQNAVFCMLPVLLLAPGLWLLAPRKVLMLVVVSIASTLATSYLALRWGGYWFAPGAGLMALVLLYPLWSWCRLEVAINYLDDELVRLHRQDTALTLPEPTPGGDLLDHRIDSLRHAAAELRALHLFISGAIGSLPDITVVADNSGKIVLANQAAAQYLGVSQLADLRGRWLPQLMHSLVLVDGASLFETSQGLPDTHDAGPAFRTIAANISEAGIGCQDTQGRDFLLKVAPCADPSGQFSVWIFSLIDISALREAERKRDATLRFLSHDMRSPQAAIQALLNLRHSNPHAMSHDELLDRIQGHVGRTQALADNFVQLARAESLALKREFVDYTAVMLDATDACWALAQAKSIRVQTELPDDPAGGMGDSDMLTRALINLVDNAIKYSPPGSVVSCAVRAAERGWWCLSVQDQGRGIAPADHARVFQQFARFGDAENEQSGIGLGLAFVKTVAQRHGGRVEFDSEPGIGTEFRFYARSEPK